ANRVYAFDPISGELLWEWSNNKGRAYSAAAVWPVKANGKLFVVTPERKIYALDAATGRELWSARGGREAIGLSESALALNAVASGYVPVNHDVANTTDSQSAYDTQIAIAAALPAAVYIKTMQDTVIAFSTGSYKAGRGKAGEPVKIWESHTGYGYEIAPSPITSAYGLVFIPTDKGNIFALNAFDGSVAWSYRFSIALINYILPVDSNQLLVTSMDGKVALLKLSQSYLESVTDE
ncbi:MAG: PQQ-binding-like beta-propeller repeat protein, partial [Bacteroidales bacterium]